MPKTPRQAFLLAAALVAVLDGLDAVVFWGLRGVAPGRVFQGVAAGLLGREAAVAGGAAAAALGVALHVLIATAVVAVYFLAARRIGWLTRRPWLAGALYGIAVFLTMSLVVIPLSAAPGGGLPARPILLNGLAIHVAGVGWPAALLARRARRLGEPQGTAATAAAA